MKYGHVTFEWRVQDKIILLITCRDQGKDLLERIINPYIDKIKK